MFPLKLLRTTATLYLYRYIREKLLNAFLKFDKKEMLNVFI